MNSKKKNPAFSDKLLICSFPLLPKLVDVGLEVYPYSPGQDEDGPQAVQIKLRLSDNVIYFKAPEVARWDPAGMNLGHKFILNFNSGIYTWVGLLLQSSCKEKGQFEAQK